MSPREDFCRRLAANLGRLLQRTPAAAGPPALRGLVQALAADAGDRAGWLALADLSQEVPGLRDAVGVRLACVRVAEILGQEDDGWWVRHRLLLRRDFLREYARLPAATVQALGLSE